MHPAASARAGASRRRRRGSRCGPRARPRSARRRRPTRSRRALLVGVVGVARGCAGGRGRRSRARRAGGRTPPRRLRCSSSRARDAAEVQVGRKQRRPPVSRSRALVVGGVSPSHREHARRPARLAAGIGSAAPCSSPARDLPPSSRRARRPCAARRGSRAAGAAPGAAEGREDDVGLELADVGDEVAGRAAAASTPRFSAPPPAGRGAWRTASVGGEVHGGRAVLARQLRHSVSGAPPRTTRSRRAPAARRAGP